MRLARHVTGSVHTGFPGSTTGPDLLGVAVNFEEAGHKRAAYMFDEPLDRTPAAPYEASKFGFYNATDTPISAAGAVSISGKSATVTFSAAPQARERDPFFIDPGAVTIVRRRRRSVGCRSSRQRLRTS